MEKQQDELNVDETAVALGVTVATVYNLVKRGLLTKHQKPFGAGLGGRRTFFKRAEVEALRNREEQPEKKKQTR